MHVIKWPEKNKCLQDKYLEKRPHKKRKSDKYAEKNQIEEYL